MVDIYKAVQVCTSMEQAETIVNNGIAQTEESIGVIEDQIRNLMEQVERELRKMEEEDRSGEEWKDGDGR